MHGQFYSQQHYLQQQGRVSAPQNPGTSRSLSDLGAQSHLPAHYVTQHAAAVNGQTYQGHLPQQRIQQISHHPTLSQHYNQLLQGHNYQALYNPAQQLQASHHQVSQQAQQQQQALLQRQQTAAQEANLRSLLASNPYHMQSALLNQLGISQSSVAAQHVTNNLLLGEHTQATSKTTTPQISRVQPNEQQQARVSLLREPAVPVNQRVTSQGIAPPLRTVRMPTAHQQGATAQTMSNQDILRHLSPNAHSRIPTTFHQSVSPNIYQNLRLNPEMQSPSGIISPHRSTYSPTISHLGHINPGRIPTTPHQMTRTEIPTVQDQYSGNYVQNQTHTTTPRQELQSPPQKPTTSGVVVDAAACVKRQTPSVNSCSAVLIISDSEDDEDAQPQTEQQWNETTNESKLEDSQQDFTRVVIDDDIEITGIKQAEIMSHMRADCPIHPFKKIDNVDVGPVEQNASRCAKCYCYVCDKLAAGCSSWTIPTFPHCNAHSRASCWKARRNTKKSPLMSKLSAEDITQEIEKAGEIAMQHMIKIREAYITYRAGTPCEYNQVPCNCACHRAARHHDPCMHCKAVHDQKKKFNYEPVRNVALACIGDINQKFSSDHPASALIMLEAVLSELCAHRPADFNHNTRMPSNPDTRCQCNTPHIMELYIEKEMIEILTKNEVSKSLRKNLVKCVEEAIKPLQLKDVMKKFLGMRHWDDLLLRAVLSGSNVTGSKNRDVLRETAEVVKIRVEKLDQERRYQSIIRYLKAVKVYQGSKATMSGIQFDVLMGQWTVYYMAKQGHFKEVILRITEQKAGTAVCALATMPPDFVIRLLDALAGVDVAPETRLDSFDSTRAPGPYSITGKDADVLLLVFEYILEQNRSASIHIPCYLWLAKWVNRTPLAPCVDPNMIRLWVGQAKTILENAQRVCTQKHCQMLLMQCTVHDPHVHLFTASMNILNAASKLRTHFHPTHIEGIINCYENNEWALFHLLTQHGLMSFGDTKIIQWISNYAKNNNGVLAQVNEKVLVDVVQMYSLDNVSDLMRSFIKANWTNSIEKIQKTVVMLASEYASRLFAEAKTLETAVNNTKILFPYSEWLEEVVLKVFHDPSIMGPFLNDPTMASCLKNIAKACSFLHPVKKNILLYKKVSPPSEWMRKCSQLIQFLRDRCLKSLLTMEELAVYLELTLTVGDTNEMRLIFSMFQNQHSCSETSDAPTSAKVVREISVILDMPNPNLNRQKCVMMEVARQLCCQETLSWLICTECSKKMPTGWTSVWLSLGKAGLNETLAQLNLATVSQFREWLQELSLKTAEDYLRLLKCVRSFLETLLIVRQQSHAISLEHCQSLLLDASKAIKDPQLQREFSLLIQELINAEIEKQRPKVTLPPSVVHEERRPPSNDMQVRYAPPYSGTSPAVTSPDLRPQQRQQQAPQHVDPAPRETHHPEKIVSPRRSKEPEQPETLPSPPRPSTSVLQPPKKTVPAPTAEDPAWDTKKDVPEPISKSEPAKTQAVMSTDALFKRANPSSTPQLSRVPSKSPPEKTTPPRPLKEVPQPFSPTNPTRTKVCQNCKETISCASFKCPRCQKSTRTVQPVTCPDCGQENHELKGYACQFCYRSLLPVLFGGGSEESRASSDPPKSTLKTKRKKRPKKKSAEKKRLASRTDEEGTSATETHNESDSTLEPPAKKVSQDNQERIQPLKVKLNRGHQIDPKGHGDQSGDQGSKGHTSEVKGHPVHDQSHSDQGQLINKGRRGDIKGRQGHRNDLKSRTSQGRPSQDYHTVGHSDQVQSHPKQPQGHTASSLTDSSDSDSADDFRPQPPPKKRRKQVPPIILKRRPSAATLSEDESDADERSNALIVSSETPVVRQSVERKESRELKLTISSRFSSEDKASENGKSRRMSSQGPKSVPKEPEIANHGTVQSSIPQPHFYNRPPVITNDNLSPQRAGLKVALGQTTQQLGATKRRVGHSSTMSKKQKNILSRMKKIGNVSKKGPKTTPPNPHPSQKDLLRSPMQSKRPSFENGTLSSPSRNSVDLIRQGERQRHDSSCSAASSVGSPSRALSFTLAAVEKSPLSNIKRSPHGPRNIGVRSGGPPSSRKYEVNRDLPSGEGTSQHKKTLVPQPLNVMVTPDGQKRKKKHKKRKEHAQKMISQKRYDSLVAKRKPGPASKTGYRHLLKMAHRLKKQQALPHRRWRIPSHIKVPRHVNLSQYVVVSLALFPRKKLARIQSLVPNYKLHNLYA